MPDNKKLKGKSDRDKIASKEPYEVTYEAKKLGVSTQQVVGAIKAVGISRKKVEEYIKNKSK